MARMITDKERAVVRGDMRGHIKAIWTADTGTSTWEYNFLQSVERQLDAGKAPANFTDAQINKLIETYDRIVLHTI